MRLSLILLPTIAGLIAGFGGPPAAHTVRAWLWPTPEQVAAAQKAEAEHQAQKAEWVRQDTMRRSAEVGGNLSNRHPGCSFDDLGTYTTGDQVRHPIFAIFCPGQVVTTNTTREEKRTEGKVEHTYEWPEATTTDTPGEEEEKSQ